MTETLEMRHAEIWEARAVRMIATRRGMTLVEILIVVILLGMVATMTTIRFAAPLRQQRVQSTAQQWLSIDFMARKLGRHADITIRIEPSVNKSIVSLERNGSVVREWAVVKPVSIAVEDAQGNPIREIRFVQSYGSTDYRITVHEGELHQFMEVAGGTGKVRYDAWH